MKQTEWESAFAKYDIPELLDVVRPFAKPSIIFEISPKGDDEFLLGQSKIGGLPHLPESIVWEDIHWIIEYDPEDDEERLGKQNTLGFLAQINLKEIRSYDTEGLLPAEGMLYFFYDIEQQVPWSCLNTNQFARALYFPGGTPLNKTTQPESVQFLLESFSLNFETEQNLPPAESPEILNLNLELLQLDSYKMARHFYNLSNINRMLGYPDPNQMAYRFERELYSDLRIEINPNKSDWICLLQLHSDTTTDTLRWGPTENGTLYFLIKELDLKEKRFDKMAFAFQP